MCSEDEINWDDYYPVMQRHEFVCSHTGRVEMKKHFLDLLYKLRIEIDESLTFSSGYRHPTHPIEAAKEEPGYHSEGIAVDIACWSDKAFRIIKIAMKLGFTGIGVSQRSKVDRFIHLDTRPGSDPPRVYSY